MRDRVAVVTGAASGFGREIALLLAREGAAVEAAGLGRTADAIATRGGAALAGHRRPLSRASAPRAAVRRRC